MKLQAFHNCPTPPRFAASIGQKRKEVTDFMRANLLKPDDSVLVPYHYEYCYRAARDLGIRITVRKMNGCGYMVWRKDF